MVSGQGQSQDLTRRHRADTVLFIDARHIYRQVDCAHRDWTPAQIGFIANLVRRYRGEALDVTFGGEDFNEQLVALNEELEVLNTQALELQTRIAKCGIVINLS